MAKKSSKKKSSKKAAKASTKKTAAKKSSGGDENWVTIQDLAEEAGIDQQTARVKLRDHDDDLREEGQSRWRWKPASKNLKAARKVLGV